MDAVIPAAGRGSRLGALTTDRNKCAIPVADRPLAAHAMAALGAVSPDRYVVVVGYEAESVISAIGDTFQGIPVTYVHQRDRRGLADALLVARSSVEGSVALLNGDNVLQANLDRVTDPLEAGADGAILVDTVSTEAAARTGVVHTDGDRVTHIEEKPAEATSRTVTTGCYVLPEAVFHACELVQPNDTGEYELADAINLLCRAGYEIPAVPLEGARINVNTPTDLARAARLLETEAE